MRYPLRFSNLFLTGLVLALGGSPGAVGSATAAERPVAGVERRPWGIADLVGLLDSNS